MLPDHQYASLGNASKGGLRLNVTGRAPALARLDMQHDGVADFLIEPPAPRDAEPSSGKCAASNDRKLRTVEAGGLHAALGDAVLELHHMLADIAEKEARLLNLCRIASQRCSADEWRKSLGGKRSDSHAPNDSSIAVYFSLPRHNVRRAHYFWTMVV